VLLHRRHDASDVFWTLLGLWLVLLAAFNIFPQIDHSISAHFFVLEACNAATTPGENCGHFPYRQVSYLQLLRTLFLRLPLMVAVVLLWKLIDCCRHHGATFNAKRARALKVALGSLVIGPIVLVNFILKSFWGRPRPSETLDFGGHLDFVQAGSMAGKCLSNCSFVSGEAAGAGWLVCVVLLVPQPLRSALLPPLAAISLLAPALRVAFGAHYLSDVVLGWLSSLVVFAGLLALADSPQREKKLKFE
jgi:membrane-associated phospholipid phosphatase